MYKEDVNSNFPLKKALWFVIIFSKLILNQSKKRIGVFLFDSKRYFSLKKNIACVLMQLNLHIYTPTDYVFPSKLDKYVDTSKNVNKQGREQGIRRLMSINLLKRSLIKAALIHGYCSKLTNKSPITSFLC